MNPIERRSQAIKDYISGKITVDEVRKFTIEMHRYLAEERAKLRKIVHYSARLRQECQRTKNSLVSHFGIRESQKFIEQAIAPDSLPITSH